MHLSQKQFTYKSVTELLMMGLLFFAALYNESAIFAQQYCFNQPSDIMKLVVNKPAWWNAGPSTVMPAIVPH